MHGRWLALAAFAVGLLAGAAGYRALAPAPEAPAPSAAVEVERTRLQAQLAEARQEVERLRAELARRTPPEPRAGEEAVQRLALAVARAAYRALLDGDGRALALLHPDPTAIELHVPTADGGTRYATLAEPDALAALAAWVRERRPGHEPAGQYFADPHAPDGGGFHNVLLTLAGGYLFVQLDGDGHVVKVAGMTEAPDFD